MPIPNPPPATSKTGWPTWDLSLAPFPGDVFAPDMVATVGETEFHSYDMNQSLKYHPWALKNAPNGEIWQPPAGLEPDLVKYLRQATRYKLYDATYRRWNLGPNPCGIELSRGFRRLLGSLLCLWKSESSDALIASQHLKQLPNFQCLNKAAPLLALCRYQNDRDPDPQPGYANCVVPIEILEGNITDVTIPDVRKQLAIYARRCMWQRPERQRISCLLLTSTSLYVYVFDRNGYHTTRSINFHEQPKEFLYVIYTLSQPDSSLPHIFWYNGVQYMLFGKNRYQVKELVYASPELFGRATACWKVKSDNGEYLCVKKTYDDAKSIEVSEAVMLSGATGLEGVAELVNYNEESTGYEFDDLGDGCDINEDPRSQYSRQLALARRLRLLVTEYYERDITQYENRRELLHVFRDAIVGHKNLWELGTCHRDICPKNIRIKEGLPQSKGVLVGLDKAKTANAMPMKVVLRMPDVVDKHFFQSMHVLRAAEAGALAFPDCWDDLESFFYVLCFICGAHQDVFIDWDSSEKGVSLKAKLRFCSQPITTSVVHSYFSPAFIELLEGMRKFVYTHDQMWLGVWEEQNMLPPPDPKNLYGYECFLALIDVAINEITRLSFTIPGT